jgi:hypothetical protein
VSKRRRSSRKFEAVKFLLPERSKQMSVHIKKGTPMHGPSLCETCTRAHRVQGYRESESFALCRATYPRLFRIAFAVRECSSYVNKVRSTLDEMERIAWTVAPRGSKRQAGFVAPGEVKEGEGEIELVLNDEA